MNGGIVAIRKMPDLLPGHAWKNATGKGEQIRVVSMQLPKKEDSTPIWRQKEIIAEAVLNKTSKIELQPLTQDEKKEWLDRLMERIPKNSHSC